jgi:hypothetical protein
LSLTLPPRSTPSTLHTVLLAYVLIATGRSEDALERLQPLIAGELPQREVVALAANNWAVACFNTGRYRVV